MLMVYSIKMYNINYDTGHETKPFLKSGHLSYRLEKVLYNSINKRNKQKYKLKIKTEVNTTLFSINHWNHNINNEWNELRKSCRN